MKTFSTNGTGSQQTLSPIESDKMPIYNSMADAEADLANLEEGQLVAIEDTGDELAQPVDTVRAGNLHAVTSNAVAIVASSKCATQNINNAQVNGVLRNRYSEGVVTINAVNNSGTGLSIDFNFTGGTITVFKMVNGSAVEQKSVILS